MNSFLLVAGKQELEEKEEILYVKLNQGRRKEFRTLTQLIRKEESVWAEKKPLCPEAENFIAGLKKQERRNQEKVLVIFRADMRMGESCIRY